LSRVTIARDCAGTAAAPSPRIEFVTQIARRRQRRRAATCRHVVGHRATHQQICRTCIN
jgi:hypothetical protein